MANIINQIIEIDAIAQKKLDKANQYKIKMVQETKTQKAKDNALIQKETDEKIASILSEEQKMFETSKNEILQKGKEAVTQLEKIYEEKHEKLEHDIFNNVLGISL